jgi:Ulp1 family protease
MSNGFAELDYKKLPVKQQDNSNDCGFLVLSFIKRIAEGTISMRLVKRVCQVKIVSR